MPELTDEIPSGADLEAYCRQGVRHVLDDALLFDRVTAAALE
jgi:hypothetical protein